MADRMLVGRNEEGEKQEKSDSGLKQWLTGRGGRDRKVKGERTVERGSVIRSCAAPALSARSLAQFRDANLGEVW